MSGYQEFLLERENRGASHGFPPVFMPSALFEFQEFLADWSIRQGRAALLADCGLGKTFLELVWAENVARKTDKPVLINAPLAVAGQIVDEGKKFGIECHKSTDGSVKGRVTVSNYEKLHMFDPQDFGGMVCDESSILKSFDGSRRRQITDFMRKMEYRLLATATAAPNDYTELGTSSEALGYLGHMDMLGKFFVNDQNNIAAKRFYGEAPKWRFKGHAEVPFWRWVSSWARACRKPSDLGFDDDRFNLPDLIENWHIVEAPGAGDDMLFTLPADTLHEQRAERKRTLLERCEQVVELVDHGKQAVAWCHFNDEGDLLESLIPDAIQVSGKDSDDAKERKFEDFTSGRARVLVTKPRIGGWGLNWQHVDHTVYFPSHSYEAYYQAIRRFWRFGQKNPVTVDIVLTEGERKVMKNLQAKSEAASAMFDNLVREMKNALKIDHRVTFNDREEMPSWL